MWKAANIYYRFIFMELQLLISQCSILLVLIALPVT